MTTAASRKRKSPEPERVDDAHNDAEIPTTPTEGPARKKLKLTQTQKQALIDNLQLESMSTKGCAYLHRLEEC